MYIFQGTNINYQISQHYHEFYRPACLPISSRVCHTLTLDQTEKLNAAAQMGHVKEKPVIWDHETY